MKIIRPNRIKYTYLQTINALPAKVFPLLCPVREKEWVGGWNPLLVVSKCGFAEMDCSFITKKNIEKNYWVVTKYDRKNFEIEMIIVSPDITIGKLQIKLSKANSSKTKAKISYVYTSLSKKGDKFIKEFTRDKYKSFMKSWEDEINYFLLNHKKLYK